MKPRTELATEYSDGELVMLDKDGGEVHQLNEAASIVWKGMSEGLGVDDIATELTSNFEVDREKALSDVHEAVRQFSKLGLLEI